jgi:hypothetical protein
MTKKLIKKEQRRLYLSEMTLAEAITQFQELSEEFGSSAFLGEDWKDSYSDSDDKDLIVYKMVEESDQEYQKRLAVEAKQRAHREEYEQALFAQLKKKYEQ